MATRGVPSGCIWILAIAICAGLLESEPRANARPVVFSWFSPIVVDGATTTQAWGINASGDVVGSYVNATGQHGFVLSGGVFTTLDFPSLDPANPVVGTEARGIGPVPRPAKYQDMPGFALGGGGARPIARRGFHGPATMPTGHPACRGWRPHCL